MTPQELKNSILQLAIQGKLVEQRPEEGMAAELLEKITRHGTTGTHGTTKTTGTTRQNRAPRVVRRVSSVSSVPVVPSVPDDEKPFDIPESWEWVRLGDVIFNHGQKTPSEDFSYIDIGSIDNKNQRLSEKETIVHASDASPRARKIVNKGDVLYATVRPYLHNVCIIDRDFSHEPIASTGFAVMACAACLDNRFLFHFLLSPDFDRYANSAENAKGVAYPAISDKRLYNAIIPLPPLAEQKRIVAKIEELLPLIDRYEKAWSKLEDFNKRFPVDMQKSLLQMAIQGKLVEQRAEEGTGEELYCQIQAEKQRLIKSGKIKKEKPLPEITEDEIPFEIPESWKWVRLGILCELVTSGSRDWAKFYSDTGDMFLRMGNLSRNSFKLRLDKIQHVKIPRTTEGQRTSLQAGDLLFSITGEVGTLGLIPEGFGKAYINQHTAMIRFLMSERNRYVPYLMLTDYAQKYYNGNQHGIKNSFRLDSIAFMPIPLPPLAEQKRIVAKLEELLPLCERLKSPSISSSKS